MLMLLWNDTEFRADKALHAAQQLLALDLFAASCAVEPATSATDIPSAHAAFSVAVAGLLVAAVAASGACDRARILLCSLLAPISLFGVIMVNDDER